MQIRRSSTQADAPFAGGAAPGPPRRAVESGEPTGEVFQRYGSADATVVAAALARARAAQPDWAARSASDRAAVVRRFHDVLYRSRARARGIARIPSSRICPGI